jgi:hypothetical protein
MTATRDRRKPHPREDRTGMTAAVLLHHRALRAADTSPRSDASRRSEGRTTTSA